MTMFCSTVRCKEEYERLRRACKVHHTPPSLVQRDLRHFDNRLRTGQHVELLHEFDDLFPPHLRHRSIENLDRHKGLDNLLRGVPLDPQLWPHLNERCRPGGKHIPLVEQVKVHRACRPGRRSLLAKGVVHLALLSPAPGLALSPWGGMVLVRGQEHLQ